MKNKITLLIAAIFAIPAAFAAYGADRLSQNAVKIFESAFQFLINIFEISVIRKGFTLIIFFIILHNIYFMVIKNIKVFGRNPKTISVPLALLSTFSVYYFVAPRMSIEKVFIPLVVAIITIYLFKLVIKIADGFGKRTNHRRARKDEHKLGKLAKSEEKKDSKIKKGLRNINDFSKKAYLHTKNEEELYDEIEKNARKALENIENISKYKSYLNRR